MNEQRLPNAIDMASQLREASNLLTRLFAACVSQPDDRSEVTTLVAQAADLIRDAERLLPHPGLRRVQCVASGSHVHALQKGARWDVLCGHELDPLDTYLPSFRAPSCPECIALLVGDHAGRT